MSIYQKLVETVVMNKRNRLLSYDISLKLVGKGRSAFVFRIRGTDRVIKVFFQNYIHLAKEEVEIYQMLAGIDYYPSIYDAGKNYFVMDYIAGNTLFECMTNGRIITEGHLKEIDYALSMASDVGLNPSDIHLRNIFITFNDEIKLIDVARFRQTKDCRQWDNLKKAYHQFYCKPFFLKKTTTVLLNMIAYFYKKGLIPFYK